MFQIVLYFLHSTSVLSFHIDVVFTFSFLLYLLHRHLVWIVHLLLLDPLWVYQQRNHSGSSHTQLPLHSLAMASYQIRKITRYINCVCAGNAGNVFPVTHVPWCMSGVLSCRGGENVPGIPGACATRKFTYLAGGPWSIKSWAIPSGLDQSGSSLYGIIYCRWGCNHSTNWQPF